MKPWPFILLFLASIPIALAIPDSMWLALPPNSTSCFQIVLPDDAGAILAGTHMIIITTYPQDPTEYWGLLGQTVSYAATNASVENTVTYPFCFTTENRPEGQSGANFTIRIAVEGTNITRTITGGVTVSEKPDFDSGPVRTESPRAVINSQTDIFDIAFSKPAYFGQPGQPVSLRLAIQSYSDITLNLAIESSADVQIEQDTVSLSAGQPVRDIGLTATAQVGSWSIAVSANVVGCPTCSKRAETMLYINESAPEQTGWTVSVFPKSLDTGPGQTVDLRATITNNGPPANFNISLITNLPYTLGQELVLAGTGQTDIPFSIQMPDQAGLYSVLIRASSANVTKSDTAWLSVKEMDSDIARQASDIKNQNPAAGQAVDQALGQWTSSGQSLQDYQQVLASMQAANQTAPEISEEQLEERPEGWPWWAWPAIAGPIAVLVVVLLLRRLKFQQKAGYSIPIRPFRWSTIFL